jgi:hypothetical protein
MRVLICAVVLLVASDAIAAERSKIYDSRNRQVGDVYDPGHGRRLQIRDNDRRIIGYIEADGDITLPNRKKVGEIDNALED